MEKWKELGSKTIIDSKYTNVYQKGYHLPSGLTIPDWYIIGRQDYVLILAETFDNKFIIEKQYRPATDSFYYEVPAGAIDTDESPTQAALRELQEETGYAGIEPQVILKTSPLPGLVECWTYIVHIKVGLKKDILNDDTVKIETLTLKASEIESMIKAGEMFDLGALATFYAAKII